VDSRLFGTQFLVETLMGKKKLHERRKGKKGDLNNKKKRGWEGKVVKRGGAT